MDPRIAPSFACSSGGRGSFTNSIAAKPDPIQRWAPAHRFQAGLLTSGSPYCLRLPAGLLAGSDVCRYRPRLQRRDRAGFAPASLLNPKRCLNSAFIFKVKTSRLSRKKSDPPEVRLRGRRRRPRRWWAWRQETPGEPAAPRATSAGRPYQPNGAGVPG